MEENRKLAASEQALEIANRRAHSLQVVTIGRVIGPLTAEVLKPALDLLQKRHPRLKSRIVGDLSNLRFADGAIKIPLRVVKKADSSRWQEVVLEELNQKIESQQGLVRAVLVHFERENNVSYLLVTLHHAISDGLSSIQLYSEILTYCQKIASGEPIGEVTSLPPLPSIERLLPKSLQGFPGLINGFYNLLRLKFLRDWHRPETLGFEEYVAFESRRSNMVHRHLDEELTERVVNCCRQEKTTVQAALSAAMMRAVAKQIAVGKRIDVRLCCQSFVSLRNHIQPIIDNENLGMLVSFIISFHTLKPNTSFWDLARDVRQQIETNLEGDAIFSLILMLRNIFEFLLARPREIPASVALSNIGRVNIPQVYGLFKIEEISFTTAAANSGGALVATVLTFAGKMFLNFTFSEPSISQKTMEQVANITITCLIDACKEVQTDKKS
ncbi:MAG: hypothetical protein JOZ78_03405 [Chroococcidiopsidaceae cyanobacterium CP_BM_ER_R8_30]|nr:hypothetical protein [Chroococcidiopsidaceae cyanobacterium CP_BM_ER_R8_30]